MAAQLNTSRYLLHHLLNTILAYRLQEAHLARYPYSPQYSSTDHASSRKPIETHPSLIRADAPSAIRLQCYSLAANHEHTQVANL